MGSYDCRFNQVGEQGIRDQRLTLPGAPCLLTASQQQELDQAFDQPPADGACGAAPKWPPGWHSDSDDLSTHAGTGSTCSAWEGAPACPARSMKRAIKLPSKLVKNCRRRSPSCIKALPRPSIELWSQDEHRIGLKPILRRVRARKGTRVRAMVRPRYQWMYLHGFMQPQSGRLVGCRPRARSASSHNAMTLSQVSSAQISYALLSASLRLFVPQQQDTARQHVIPFQSPAIAWFLPLFTRLRLLLNAPSHHCEHTRQESQDMTTA